MRVRGSLASIAPAAQRKVRRAGWRRTGRQADEPDPDLRRPGAQRARQRRLHALHARRRGDAATPIPLLRRDRW